MDALSPLGAADSRLVAFTGKGGVGKTTCASATAVGLAERGERTLLLSTDRSPSLSDILETDVYGEVTAVPSVPGLDAVEMDFDAIAERWKETYGEEVYTVVSSFVPVDRWVIDYFAEAPGIATQFALSYLLEFFDGNNYDRIVWDTAPAGGTLGLIELEEKLYAHLGEAPKFYAKLRAAINRDVSMDPADLLGEWQQLAEECLAMVRNPQTTFVVVTIPESLAVNETDRIVHELGDRGVSVGAVVANEVLTEAVCECPFHRERIAMQADHRGSLESAYGADPGLISVPQFPTEITGVRSLRSVGEVLFEGDTTGISDRPSPQD